MKTLFRLAKKSAKRSFQEIREKQPYASPYIKHPISITKQFLNHIINISSKDKSYREVIERILIIPFIKEGLQNGKLAEKRKNSKGEFYKIEWKSGDDIFCFILEKQPKGIILLSCFRKFEYKKRDLS